MFIAARVQDTPLPLLVDTGASVTILSEKSFQSISPSKRPQITPVNTKLVTATGTTSSFIGQTCVEIQIDQHKFFHNVLIADINNDAILGIDFLTANNCDVLLSKSCLDVQGDKIPCFRYSNEISTCCRITVSENIVIPPGTEMIVPGRPTGQINKCAAILEPTNTFVEKQGLMIARSLVDPSKGIVPLRILNLQDEPCKIYKNTVTATCEPVHNSDIQENPATKGLHNVSTSQIETIIPELPPHLKDLYTRSTAKLQENECTALRNLLIEYQDIFSKSDKDIGHTNIIQHTIDTGNVHPIRQRPRRVPLSKMAEAEAEIKSMAAQGVIEPSTSPWSSNIVLVKKKDNSLRFCVDFRQLNDVTQKDSHPLPRIDDTLDALSGAKFYSTLDLKSGYWQVGISEADRPKTAFSFPGGGLWQFTVMAFGLCNAPATFERLMEKVLHGLSWKVCLVYLDDIIVFSKDFQGQLENLRKVFERLKFANLKLSPKKCCLFQSKVSFLGHIVSKDGVSTDPEKIKAVQEWPVPKNVKDVRSFLGLTSYYRRFIHHYAEKAKPLHQLTEKNKQFIWSEDCQNSFETLKAALIQAPILAYPSQNDHFILDTDASNYGMGAVLSQMQEGCEKVVCYFSKAFSGPQRKYCVTRRELLAIVLSIKHFHHYLYGRKFTVRTDHGALRWLLHFKNPEGQMARWLEILSAYDIEIVHRAGRSHQNADSLSRHPCFSAKCKHCQQTEMKEINYSLIDPESQQEELNHSAVQNNVHQVTTRAKKEFNNKPCSSETPDSMIPIPNEKLVELQTKDPNLSIIMEWKKNSQKPEWQYVAPFNEVVKYYWQRWESLLIQNEILYYKWESDSGKDFNLKIVIPQDLKALVLEHLHNSVIGGHLGIKKTLSKVQARYFWYHLRSDVKNWCSKCDSCASKKNPRKKYRAPLKTYNVGAPFERIAIDILGPLPRTKQGNKYLLVVGDYFSKWLEAIPLRNQEATTVASKLVERIISVFGVPLSIHSDQGSNFESEVFQELCKLLGITKTRTTPLRPQSDGMVERANRTIENMLTAFVSENQNDWDEYIYLLMLAYRSSEHESTGFSPYQMVFATQPTLPIDIILGKPETNDNQVFHTEYIELLRQKLDKIHDWARRNLNLSSKNMKRRYDYQSNAQVYKVGDPVWLYNPTRTKGRCPKLQKPWVGPFTIIHKISDILFRVQKSPHSKPKVVHHDRLKPYHGENVPTWFKL